MMQVTICYIFQAGGRSERRKDNILVGAKMLGKLPF